MIALIDCVRCPVSVEGQSIVIVNLRFESRGLEVSNQTI